MKLSTYEKAIEVVDECIQNSFPKAPTEKIIIASNLGSKFIDVGIENPIIYEYGLSYLFDKIDANKSLRAKSKDFISDFNKRVLERISIKLSEMGISYFHSTFHSYDSRFGFYREENDERIKMSIKGLSKNLLSINQINEVYGHLKIESYTPAENINCHRKLNLIHCKNGMLEIKNQQITLLEHSENYYSTSCLGVSYTPDASAPRWLNFISEVTEHYGDEKEKAIQLLQEIVGYMLIPGNNLQKFFLFYGLPRSGKSVVGHIITKILGDNNVSSLPFESLSKETRTAELSSKLLNLSGELSRGVKIDSATIKSLVGEDNVTGRKLYSDPFYFVNPAKILTICNCLPHFNDNSTAIMERLIIVNFDTQIPEDKRNPNLKNELEQELDGIFKWAIQGLISLQKRGRFVEVNKGIQAKEMVQQIADTVRYWVKELDFSNLNYDTIIEGYAKLSLKKAYDNYTEFCKNVGITIEKKIDFKSQLSLMKEVKLYRDTSRNQEYIEIKCNL